MFTLDVDEVEARGSEDRLVGIPVKAMPRLRLRLSSPLQVSLLALKPPFGLSISPDEEGDGDVDAAEAAAGRISSPFRVGSEGRSGKPSRNFEDDGEEVAGAELEVAETPAPPPLPLATGSGALLDDDDVAPVDGGYCSGSRRCS